MIGNYAYTTQIWSSVWMAVLMIALSVYSGRWRLGLDLEGADVAWVALRANDAARWRPGRVDVKLGLQAVAYQLTYIAPLAVALTI